MNTPNGLEEIIGMFGNPCAPRLRAVTLKQPVGGFSLIRVHEKLQSTFQAAYDEIFDSGNGKYLNEFGGCYCCRNIRGAKHMSTHAWGISNDLNESHNILGSIPPAKADLVNAPYVFAVDHPVVVIFKKHGFLWGGEFQHRKDPMHFQFATGY